MIGSISKVRPCGHHHHYKYVHAKNVDDMKCIAVSYKTDVNYENEFNYTLDNVINANSMFKSSGKFLQKANLYLPKATGIGDLFRASTALVRAKVVAPSATSLSSAIYYCY